MSNRRYLGILAAALVLNACGSEPEPEIAPEPTGPSAEELERMGQDSIAAALAAEEARRQAEMEAAAREAAVRAGDLGAALGEIATLPQVGRDRFADWIALAELRRDALEAVADLSARLDN